MFFQKLWCGSLNSSITSSDLSYYQEQIKYLNPKEDKEEYNLYKSYIQTLKVASRFEENSWQEAIVLEKIQPLVYNMQNTTDDEEYEEYQKQYDQILQKLDNGNWRYFAEEEKKRSRRTA